MVSEVGTRISLKGFEGSTTNSGRTLSHSTHPRESTSNTYW